MELALPEPFHTRPIELIAKPSPFDPMIHHLIGAMEAELQQDAPVGELSWTAWEKRWPYTWPRTIPPRGSRYLPDRPA